MADTHDDDDTRDEAGDVVAKVAAGGRVDADEALLLYREAPTQTLGPAWPTASAAASTRRRS